MGKIAREREKGEGGQKECVVVRMVTVFLYYKQSSSFSADVFEVAVSILQRFSGGEILTPFFRQNRHLEMLLLCSVAAPFCRRTC